LIVFFPEGPTGGSKEMALCVNAAAAAVTGLPPLQVGASKRPGSCNGAHGSSQISSFAVCNTGVLHLTATRTPLLRHSNNLVHACETQFPFCWSHNACCSWNLLSVHLDLVKILEA